MIAGSRMPLTMPPEPHGPAVVTEHTYVYTASVEDNTGRMQNVAVVFLPHDGAPAAAISVALVRHLDHQQIAHEIWFVTHAPFAAHLRNLMGDDELTHRLDRAHPGFTHRGFVIDRVGRWTALPEPLVHRTGTSIPLLPSDDGFVSQIIASGLRQMFRDARSLLTAHGNFHFGKPGRNHSKYFLRAQPAVARSTHAHLLAVTLMRSVRLDSIRRLWIDTAGIVGVAGAVGAVRALHFPQAPPLLVDSFGGYDGLAESSSGMSDDDAILISSSTSGNLAARICEESGMPPDRVLTAYYLRTKHSDGSLAAAPSCPIICDLTARSDDPRDATYVQPFPSYDSMSCPLCTDSGEVAVPIEGDGFLPVTGTLTARNILATDTTADLSPFVKLTRGAGALRVRQGAGGRVRTVATDLSRVLDQNRADFRAELQRLLRKVRSSPLEWCSRFVIFRCC